MNIHERWSNAILKPIWVTTWQNHQNECAPSEDSDQPGNPPRLIRVFTARAQWVAKDPKFLHADSEDSDQTGRMPRLIWVFAGLTLILLILSCRGSFVNPTEKQIRWAFDDNKV